MASEKQIDDNSSHLEKNQVKDVISILDTKPRDEISKEERVARITFKQGIIVAVITTLLGGITTIIIAFINKPIPQPNESNVKDKSDGVIEYYKPNIEAAVTEFDKGRNSLFEMQIAVYRRIRDEKDKNKLEQLNIILEKIRTGLEKNEKDKSKFTELAYKSLEALKKDNGVEAAVLRRQANEAAAEETNARVEINQAIIDFNKKYSPPIISELSNRNINTGSSH